MKQFDFSNIEHKITLAAKGVKMHPNDKYPMDKWCCVIRGEVFDYYTGTGLRKIPKNLSSLERDKLRAVQEQQKRTGGTWWHRSEIEKYKQPATPDIKDVLQALFLDADYGEMVHSDFCSELGYNPDSIKDMNIWLECQKTAVKIRKMFSTEEREAIRKALQDY